MTQHLLNDRKKQKNQVWVFKDSIYLNTIVKPKIKCTYGILMTKEKNFFKLHSGCHFAKCFQLTPCPVIPQVNYLILKVTIRATYIYCHIVD